MPAPGIPNIINCGICDILSVQPYNVWVVEALFQYSDVRKFYVLRDDQDDGWNISLGRGLDIYDKYNAYSIASGRQDRRKCREFRVIYMKSYNTTEHGKTE